MAVSGGGIISENLQAPAEVQALFASWQHTVTVDSWRGAEAALVGVPAPGCGAGRGHSRNRFGQPMGCRGWRNRFSDYTLGG